MSISFYKGLIRNPKIGNNPIWVFPSIWKLGQVRNKKFGTNVSNKILLNAAKCQSYSFYRFWVIKGKPTWGWVGVGKKERCKRDVEQVHSRKPWKSSTENIKNSYLKPARLRFTSCSVFDYFQSLTCYNLRNIFTNLTNLQFLETPFLFPKNGKNSHSYSHLERNNGPLNILKIKFIGDAFFKNKFLRWIFEVHLKFYYITKFWHKVKTWSGNPWQYHCRP